MPATEPSSAYRAYLLRFWLEDSEPKGQLFWRFSLESPGDGQTDGFASLDALLVFIHAQIDQMEERYLKKE